MTRRRWHEAITIAGWLGTLLAVLAGVMAALASQPLISILAFAAALGILFAVVCSRRARAAAAHDADTLKTAMARMAEGDLTARPGDLLLEPAIALRAPFVTMAESLATLFAQLSEHRSHLVAVLDTMADGVMLVDGDGRLMLANQAAQEMLALDAPAGARLSAAFRDHELQGLVALCRESQERRNVELALPSVRRSISVTATPLTSGSGAPEMSVLLTLHDLTTLRQLESTRREFVANVSHELRSPLASIKAMVETLEGGAVNDQAAATDFLDRIHREVDRMNTLVDDLLELSRIESGQSALRLETVDLVAIATSTRADFEMRIADTGVSVEVTSVGSTKVLADAAKLRQAIANFLDNALKFTPAGGRIEVRVDGAAREGSVRLQVSDNGQGIAPEHLPHLFERFYKVDRSRRDKGTGLGLAIAKHIIELHGGQIGVNSSEGAGASFWFLLPQQTDC